jgi:CDP-paratose 2-epimerase
MRVLITGGAGFVGTNLAHHFARTGHQVVLLDNLSRKGVDANLEWLRRQPGSIEFVQGDIRDPQVVSEVVKGAERIYHLAAQVAVTTSVVDPVTDFEVNLLGTVNLLEAARKHAPEAPLFYTSTNKVYGGMEDVTVVQRGERYEYEDLPLGVSEERPLDFHSPYGCSKGGADQYVRDYARIYNLPTVVFRMSCIYGPHQCGNEDQGWVAHFAREALAGRGLSFYGDGRQVRDVLYVADLVRAFEMAADAIDKTAGEVFNIGGGAENTTSLLKLVAELEETCKTSIPVHYAPWRPGDQRIYVSDIRKAAAVFGWTPRFSAREGVHNLVQWLRGAGSDAQP